jgi:hypothetical protein
MKTLKYFIFVFLFVPFLFSGCSEYFNGNDNPDSAAKIKFYLTDAPGDFQQVNIDIQAVQVIIDDSIINLETNQGIYNLLEFVNGKDTLLVTDEIPEGMLSQIRLILGENNSVVVDSVVYDIKTPSAQQSGLKLLVNRQITPGHTYEYTIDFDAAKSIVLTGKGNSKYILKPVIRVFSEEITIDGPVVGSIAGVVQPAEANPLILAIGMEDDTITTSADTLGQFLFSGLAAGYYDLEFQPDTIRGDTTYIVFADTTLADIEVISGQTTVLDTLFFH